MKNNEYYDWYVVHACQIRGCFVLLKYIMLIANNKCDASFFLLLDLFVYKKPCLLLNGQQSGNQSLLYFKNLTDCKKTCDKSCSCGASLRHFSAFRCLFLLLKIKYKMFTDRFISCPVCRMHDICIALQLLCRFCTFMMNDGY